ncbi:MAG: lipopolysaccharide kinase InaA family protein [Paramuribaculum sp.]|nr:lipopolysaccharide kinase InaA family protein [Paramuribaculum sp.]
MSTMRVNQQFVPALSATQLEIFHEVASGRIPTGAELIYNGRRNKLYNFATEVGKPSTVVKCFRLPHIVNSLVYATLRKSKARRSFENALRLIELGFHTPRPQGFIEHLRGIRLYDSYYFCEFVDAPTIRDIEQRPECDIVLRAAAADLARLHSHGIHMRDYSPGNILYRLDGRGGCTIYYVDLNRMDFGVSDHRVLMRSFGSVIWDEEALRRFAAYYAEAAGLDVESTVSEAVGEHRRFIRRRERKRRFKKLFS